jgi:hypothetical protein
MNQDILDKYVILDKSLTELNKRAKDLRMQKKILEDIITKYMIEHNESDDPKVMPQLEIGGVSLSLKKFKPKKKINQHIIKDILDTNTSEEPEKVDEIIHELFNNEDEEDVYLSLIHI